MVLVDSCFASSVAFEFGDVTGGSPKTSSIGMLSNINLMAIRGSGMKEVSTDLCPLSFG